MDRVTVEQMAAALHEAGDTRICWYDWDCNTGGKDDCKGPPDHTDQAEAVLKALYSDVSDATPDA
jgi:hypothetical protein